jgi:DNA-directed RNA polymerase specialized sigma24 family protein
MNTHGKDFTKDDFNRFLGWLDKDADPDKAALKYIELHRTLTTIFISRGCQTAEELADETITRVVKRLPAMIDTYEGDDPYRYIYRVAYNLTSEHKKVAARMSQLPDDFHLEVFQTAEDDERVYNCLEQCLSKLHPDIRRRILQYHQEEKKAKIELRKKMAQSMNINLNTLRIQMCRARAGLEKCIRRCLEGNGSSDEADSDEIE